MLYVDMSDAELVDAYWALRNALADAGELARSGRRTTRSQARRTGRQLRDFDVVCALLRRRDINPLSCTHI